MMISRLALSSSSRTRQSPTRSRCSGRPASWRSCARSGSVATLSSAAATRLPIGGSSRRMSRRAGAVNVSRHGGGSAKLVADLVQREGLAATVRCARLFERLFVFGGEGLVVERCVVEGLDDGVALASAGDERERLFGFELGELFDGLLQLLLGGHGRSKGTGMARPPVRPGPDVRTCQPISGAGRRRRGRRRTGREASGSTAVRRRS